MKLHPILRFKNLIKLANFTLAILCLCAFMEKMNAQIPVYKKPGAKPVTTTYTEPTIVETHDFVIFPNGKKTIRILKNGVTKSFVPKDKTIKSEMLCTTSEREVGMGDGESFLLEAKDVIYPGSMIDGRTVPTGGYGQIIRPRANMTLHMPDLEFENPKDGVQEVNPGQKAAVDLAIKTMAKKGIPNVTTPQIVSFSEEVNSVEDIEVALNLSCHTLLSRAKSMFSFGESKKSHTFLGVFSQVYYTVEVDPPEEPSGFFDPSISNIPANWLYVSSVKYGRYALLNISVTDESSVSSAKLKADFNALIAGGGVSASIKKLDKENKIKISYIWYGGNIEGITQVYSYNSSGNIESWIQKYYAAIQSGMVFSPKTAAMPLAYTMKFAGDPNHQTAIIDQTLKYQYRKCEDVFTYRVTLENLKCLASNDQDEWDNASEMYGKMEVYLFKYSELYNPSLSTLNKVQGFEPKTGKNVIWQLTEGQRASMKMGYKIPTTGELNAVEFTIPKELASERPYFYLTGNISEYDPHSSNEHFKDSRTSKTAEKINLDDLDKTGIPKYVSLRFFNGLSIVTANFRIEMVGGAPVKDRIPPGLTRYTVKLENIKGISNNDDNNPNNGEDIYGHLAVYLFSPSEYFSPELAKILAFQGQTPLWGDHNFLWLTKSNTRIPEVKKGMVISNVSKSVVFEFPYNSTAYFYLTGDIWEYDPDDSDDHFNSAQSSVLDKKIFLRDIPVNGAPVRFTLKFGVSNSTRIEANFLIEAKRDTSYPGTI